MLSVRGAQGGYRLARPDTEITAGEILRAVEGELTAIPCLASSVECPRRGQCPHAGFLERARTILSTNMWTA